MNIAFAGLRHDHIFTLYQMAMAHKEFHVIGAYESDIPSRLRAESLGLSCHYSTYEALLNDPQTEVVALGGCYAHRGPMAVQALRAGKHVIVDKPLCISLATLEEIKTAAKESGRKASAMFTMRYEPKLRAAAALYASGALGKINNITFGGQHPLQYGRRPMWYFEDGMHGGVINDIAIHGIDILSFAFGIKNFDILTARCWNRFADKEPQFRDSAQFMLKAENGAGILADVSYAIPDGIEFSLPMYWQFTVWGTGGVLDFALGKRDMLFYQKGRTEPLVLEELAPPTDYLTDFLNLINGEKDVILPMEDVFAATENTLKIQNAAL